MITVRDMSYHYLFARGKEITNNEEVEGLVYIDEFTPRESITQLLMIDGDNEKVAVDPVTVEFFTGLRNPVTGNRIFEGDLVQLYSPIDATIVYDCDPIYDYYGEICLPLNLVKGGARKRLYLCDGIETPDACSTEGFFQVGGHWDAMEWCVLGRTSIENEKPYEEGGKLADTILEHHNIAVYPEEEETIATTACSKSGEVWLVTYGREWGNRPLFGTFKRRVHILRRLKEFFDGKPGATFGRDLYDPKFDHLRMKWAEDYQKYVVPADAYSKMMDEKREAEEMRRIDERLKRLNK